MLDASNDKAKDRNHFAFSGVPSSPALTSLHTYIRLRTTVMYSVYSFNYNYTIALCIVAIEAKREEE